MNIFLAPKYKGVGTNPLKNKGACTNSHIITALVHTSMGVGASALILKGVGVNALGRCSNALTRGDSKNLDRSGIFQEVMLGPDGGLCICARTAII
jgi:hypothetical protein